MVKNGVEFDKGEFIFREMDPADDAYVILKGEIGVFKRSNVEGEVIPLGIVRAGEFLGELGVVNSQTRSAEAICLTPVEALRIPREQFEREFKEMPPWVHALITGMAERLVKTDELLQTNRSVDLTLLEKLRPALESSQMKLKISG